MSPEICDGAEFLCKKFDCCYWWIFADDIKFEKDYRFIFFFRYKLVIPLKAIFRVQKAKVFPTTFRATFAVFFIITGEDESLCLQLQIDLNLSASQEQIIPLCFRGWRCLQSKIGMCEPLFWVQFLHPRQSLISLSNNLITHQFSVWFLQYNQFCEFFSDKRNMQG